MHISGANHAVKAADDNGSSVGAPDADFLPDKRSRDPNDQYHMFFMVNTPRHPSSAELAAAREREKFAKETKWLASLSAEEKALVFDDTEMVQYRKELAKKRDEAKAVEDKTEGMLSSMDASIVAPLDSMRAQQQQWDAWSAEWLVLVEHEEEQQYRDDVNLEQRMWLEDGELATRQEVEEDESRTFTEMTELEQQKRRYLLDCAAWVSDWEGAFQSRWSSRVPARPQPPKEDVD